MSVWKPLWEEIDAYAQKHPEQVTDEPAPTVPTEEELLTQAKERKTEELDRAMTAIDADTLAGADYKITWKTVTSSRFDSTAFKKAMPELAERFTKPSTSRRFTVA